MWLQESSKQANIYKGLEIQGNGARSIGGVEGKKTFMGRACKAQSSLCLFAYFF